jgi:poly(3-hydroxybutyrate) depolymerase
MTPKTMTWTIEGVNRTAIVFQPAGANLPILFVFHGHGGTAAGFAGKHQFEVLWPEAIVVYAQGLPTPTPSDRSGTENGWQDFVGEVSAQTHVKDQDLKFFDEMLLKFQPSIDPRLVFVHGYSNGGGLIYNVLWPLRGAQLAGLAVDAATVNSTINRIPIPVIHIAGKSDPVVSFARQQSTVDAIKSLNNCRSIGVPYYILLAGISSTKWWSRLKKPVVFSSYDGNHDYPDNAPKVITKFFIKRAEIIQTS